MLRKIETGDVRDGGLVGREHFRQIFRYGIGCGLCKRDPSADLRGVLTPPEPLSHAASFRLEELPQLLLDIDGCEEAPACRDRLTRLGLQLMALTALRTKELRKGLGRRSIETAHMDARD